MAGPTMHTDVHKPARTIRPFPIRLTSSFTALSSQQFMLVRSKNFVFGNAALISSNIGPENVFSATVVGMVDTLKIIAELATKAALLRKSTESIDLVAKAICDWKSIRMRVWSAGVTRVLPGIGLAVGISNLLDVCLID